MDATGQTTALAPEIDKLAAALVAAQAEMPAPQKTHTARVVSQRTGAKFTYRYADLAEIIAAVRPVLAKHGLAVVQLVETTAADPVLHTRLLHASGQWIESTYPLPKLLNSQDMGSAITYERRYSLCAILGIAAEDDEDGQAATDAETEAEDQRKAEAQQKLEALKGKGQLKSAYDGHTLKPGEEAKPAPAAAVTAPPATTAEPDQLAGIDPRLAALMRKESITREQVKGYYVGKWHLPATVDPEKLPPDYVGQLVTGPNWAKALASIKKGAK